MRAAKYEFGRPDLAAALVRAHRRGIAVTVIDDPTVEVTALTALRLRAAGVDVVDYPVRRLMIDHVKLLIVDGDAAVVGGINWGDSSAANHDFDALVRGPVVANLERVYRRDLVTSGRTVDIPPVTPDPDILVAATLPSPDVRPLALVLIEQARHRLDLELFVLTDAGIVHALERAAARGVQVRLVLDPDQTPSRPSEEALRSAGVPVRWYRGGGEKLHAKAIVADGRTVLFGSANWSGGGFERNHELDIEVLSSTEVAATFLRAMSADWEAAAP